MCRQAIEMTLETRSHVSKKKDKEAVGARPPELCWTSKKLVRNSRRQGPKDGETGAGQGG